MERLAAESLEIRGSDGKSQETPKIASFLDGFSSTNSTRLHFPVYKIRFSLTPGKL